ncbi:gliding motility protein RemB, partial [Flavobacteriaceae bacterium]|nr:gliding motility protein RemB [Flavobacteriaceae bacterium]
DNSSNCFYKKTKEIFYKDFKEPSIIMKENFKGTVNAIFVVTNDGFFKLIYLNTPYEELKKEVARVFAKFPKITPAFYNNHRVEMQFVFPLSFPLSNDIQSEPISIVVTPKKDINDVLEKEIITSKNSLYKSHLNIPFTHQRYVDYEYAMHKNNKHTGSKPYLYKDVNQFINLDSIKNKFLKPAKKTLVGKKVWNEHLLAIQEKDYWFNLDVLFDVQLGKDNSNDVSFTYNNSRIVQINGGLGDKFSYSATIYESQARFAGFVNEFISNRSLVNRPAFSEGLVPGRGKAKGFKEDAFDYPVAEGYVSFTPNKFLQFQFGHGKNFIGDGYRSFILSDVAAPSLYLKASVDFWKFKYTNLWIWGNDLRTRTVINNEHARKYIAIHYLSINITERFNLGLFEAAISSSETGIDAGFLNPVMFYRSVEFNRGEDAGNALVGITAKYKLSDQASLYSQLVIDEFSVGNLTNLGDWRNKFSLQFGAKYFDAFNVENLFIQGEFNYARPYTFAHKTSVLNYGNNNQALGHLWGANFWELVGIARYKKDRWSGSAKVVFGKKGFDFIDESVSYGGNIFQSYEDRQGDTGNAIAQGNAATIFTINLQGDYLLNPSNNLSLFAGFNYRNFSLEATTNGFSTSNNIWVSAGIRADLFNWYFDF